MTTSSPVQITFHGVDHSDAIESRIRKKIEKLEKLAGKIITCHVVVEVPHKHMHKGKLYSIKIDLSVPGDEIVVNRDSDKDHSHEDIYVAIRDSFNEAKRQLQDYLRRRQGKTKTHRKPGNESGPETRD